MTDNYDVVVIGGGLSGFAAATEAADKSLKTLLV
ncbi:FAD-dependent oxidoreductase, partial [Lactobacillus apis]